ncbi:chlorohydrolase [Streptococcus pneumoniae]|nr:chlorohydrolase [Streptococcus pneumoniae]
MKIKEQTRKLAAGYSKHCFEVVSKSAQNTVLRWDRTDEVSSKHGFEVVEQGKADVV